MIKICHMTSAHDWNDDRIFLKECQSLANSGYEVYLVAEGADKIINGVHIIGCGEKPSSRRDRMKKFAKMVYRKASGLDCDIYHFHDPEMLPYAIKFKNAGKKVIFDSHEDVSGQILDKTWIPGLFRRVISVAYRAFETYCVARFDAVVTATPHIADTFRKRNNNIVVINNYPKLDDIVFHDTDFSLREKILCYAGGLSEIRGESVMRNAMKGVDGELVLAGSYGNNEILSEDHVTYLGKINRTEVNNLYGRSRAGVVLYQPAENHYESQPIKMFEYMAAGLPVIASDFPHWRNIVEKTNCGICVDPTDIEAVRKAYKTLLLNPDYGQMLGKNGFDNVMQRYNWHVEEKKLLDLYSNI